MIDWSFRVSDLLLLIGFLGTLALLSFRSGKLMSTLETMQVEITGLKVVAAQIANVLTAVAVQKVELEHLNREVQHIKSRLEDHE